MSLAEDECRSCERTLTSGAKGRELDLAHRHLTTCNGCWTKFELPLQKASEAVRREVENDVYLPEGEHVVYINRRHRRGTLHAAVFKVWLVHGPGKRALAALKCLRKTQGSGSQGHLARFEAERAMAKRGCAVAPAYVAEAHDDTQASPLYFFTEWIDGTQLDPHPRRLSAEELNLFIRICRAVEVLHRDGIAHCDLKPEHILIDANGRVWILDFGSHVKTRVGNAGASARERPGTDTYRAPEQIDEAWGSLGTATDVWALAVILCVRITQRHPFAGADNHHPTDDPALFTNIQFAPPFQGSATSASAAPSWEALAKLGPSVPRLIRGALAKSPPHRFQNAGQLALLAELATQRRCGSRLRLSWHFGRRGRLPAARGIGEAAVYWAMATLLTGVLVVLVVLLCLSFGLSWYAPARNKPTFLAAQSPELLKLTRSKITVYRASSGDLAQVRRFAEDKELPAPSEQRTTWRPTYGAVMEKLAEVRPLVVIWDFVFRGGSEGDEQFLRGVRALNAAGVPVIIGDELDQKGQSVTSPALVDAFGPLFSSGQYLARRQTTHTGEFVLALRHRDVVWPSAILAAYAALLAPGARYSIQTDEPPSLLSVHFDSEPVVRVDRERHGRWMTGGPHCFAIDRAIKPSVFSRSCPAATALIVKIPLENPRRRNLGMQDFGNLLWSELKPGDFEDRVVLIGTDETDDEHLMRAPDGTIVPVAGPLLAGDFMAAALADRYALQLVKDDRWALLAVPAGLVFGSSVLLLLYCSGRAVRSAVPLLSVSGAAYLGSILALWASGSAMIARGALGISAAAAAGVGGALLLSLRQPRPRPQRVTASPQSMSSAPQTMPDANTQAKSDQRIGRDTESNGRGESMGPPLSCTAHE